MKRISGLMMALVMVLGFSVQSHATLILRGTDTLGNGLIYDDDLNITWYDYTRSWDNWWNQVAWAEALTVYFGGVVYDDWRLPSTVDGPGNWGYNITTSEMGHLYYTELGNLADSGLNNTGPFNNLQDGLYWSGTECAADPGYAWDFFFYLGFQYANGNLSNHYALAVRPGDVAAGVPEPGTLFLLGFGLASMGICRKRFRRRHG